MSWAVGVSVAGVPFGDGQLANKKPPLNLRIGLATDNADGSVFEETSGGGMSEYRLRGPRWSVI